MTWTALHAVTTGNQAGGHGWAIFDHVGGDPDGLAATSGNVLYAVGGWFWTNTPASDLAIYVDGARVDLATLRIDTSSRFLGVVVPGGFTRFEIRDLESSPLDIRHWFADDFTFSVGAPAPHGTTGVVPGVANVHGLAGSDWHTDLVVHNAGSATALVELDFAPRGGELRRERAPAASPSPPDRPSRCPTSSPPCSRNRRAGRCTGSWSPATSRPCSCPPPHTTAPRTGAATAPRSRACGGARPLPPACPRARSPLPATSAPTSRSPPTRPAPPPTCGSSTAEARCAWHETLPIPPASFLQLDDIFVRAFPGVLSDPSAATLLEGLHRIEVAGVGGQLVAAASIVDNTTNDPTNLLAAAPAARALWLPAAAATPGANGSQWSSDLLLANPGPVDTNATLVLATATGASQPVLVTLPAGQATALADVVRSAFLASAPTSGSIAVVSSQPVLAWMRTSTVAGGAAPTATFGQGTEAVADGATLAAGGEARIAGFSHGPYQRSNLILQNTRLDASGMPLATAVTVEVLLADGTPTAGSTYSLGPGEYLQHNRFIEASGLSEIAGGALRLRLVDDGVPGTGGVVALVTEVDGNFVPGTNDSRCLMARRVPATGP